MSVLKELQDSHGFWMPNSVVDKCLPYIGVRGIGLYCILARCEEQAEYPTVAQLSKRIKMSQDMIRTLFGQFHGYGLLNDSDLAKFNIVLSEVQEPDDE